jgi:hypothetical protein
MIEKYDKIERITNLLTNLENTTKDNKKDRKILQGQKCESQLIQPSILLGPSNFCESFLHFSLSILKFEI